MAILSIKRIKFYCFQLFSFLDCIFNNLIPTNFTPIVDDAGPRMSLPGPCFQPYSCVEILAFLIH